MAAALGADDVFVAVDKWKNARLENPSFTTQDIAAIALPDAASAMLLTTSTTAVAFFATTICPVLPILCFALFCGLMIMFNYFLNIFFIFPALCLYDIWLMNGSKNILINCGCCSKPIEEEVDNEANELEASEEEKKISLIHRILSFYYHYMHITRYGLLAAILVATGVCIYVALKVSVYICLHDNVSLVSTTLELITWSFALFLILQIRLPDSVDVRLLPADNPYELHFKWKQQLLSYVLFYAGGSFGQITVSITSFISN